MYIESSVNILFLIRVYINIYIYIYIIATVVFPPLLTLPRFILEFGFLNADTNHACALKYTEINFVTILLTHMRIIPFVVVQMAWKQQPHRQERHQEK